MRLNGEIKRKDNTHTLKQTHCLRQVIISARGNSIKHFITTYRILSLWWLYCAVIQSNQNWNGMQCDRRHDLATHEQIRKFHKKHREKCIQFLWSVICLSLSLSLSGLWLLITNILENNVLSNIWKATQSKPIKIDYFISLWLRTKQKNQPKKNCIFPDNKNH